MRSNAVHIPRLHNVQRTSLTYSGIFPPPRTLDRGHRCSLRQARRSSSARGGSRMLEHFRPARTAPHGPSPPLRQRRSSSLTAATALDSRVERHHSVTGEPSTASLDNDVGTRQIPPRANGNRHTFATGPWARFRTELSVRRRRSAFRTTRFLRRRITVVALVSSLAAMVMAGTGEAASADVATGLTSHRAASVTSGNARFQVLSPTLIRTEYAQDGKFTDSATFNAIGRTAFASTQYTSSTSNGWLTISTSALTLKYQVDSGPFDAQNLSVHLSAGGSAVDATPGTGSPAAWAPCARPSNWPTAGPVSPRTTPVTPAPVSSPASRGRATPCRPTSTSPRRGRTRSTRATPTTSAGTARTPPAPSRSRWTAARTAR